jgi:DNA primase
MAIHREAPRAPPIKGVGRIPEQFIAQVNERADILKVIERSVKLKKAGANNYLGLCPFHKERTPSFTVAPHKGIYKCFGCGASGGALSFLMEHDGTPFRDAVKELAHDAGLALPPEMTEGEASGGPAVETGPLFHSMDIAAKCFGHVLRHTPAAIDYLKGRGVTAAGARKFLLGMAPDEWRGLKEAFPDYETNPFILQAGLVREKTSDDGRTNRYDTFRNRITFGVRDTRGRIVAFGGRVLGDGEPKYLNSPESPIFNKSGALFGLYEAREAIRQKKLAIVVEGYMDVVMLSQFGVENVVASMGTSFTRWHVERLLTQSDAIAFAFDGDAAGRKAAWRAMETCVNVVEDHHDIRFLILPGNLDPDDLVQAEGAAAFDERVRKAPSLSEFLVSELTLKHNNLATAEDRARFASEGSNVAGRLSYRTKLRGLLLQQIAAEAALPGSAIKALQSQSAARYAPVTLWSRLADAARIAPDEAVQHRAIIVELLDRDDPNEAQLAQLLLSLDPAAGVAGAPDRCEPRWLVARDALRAAIDLIVEHREQQARDDLRARFQRGDIGEQEFLREALG